MLDFVGNGLLRPSSLAVGSAPPGALDRGYSVGATDRGHVAYASLAGTVHRPAVATSRAEQYRRNGMSGYIQRPSSACPSMQAATTLDDSNAACTGEFARDPAGYEQYCFDQKATEQLFKSMQQQQELAAATRAAVNQAWQGLVIPELNQKVWHTYDSQHRQVGPHTIVELIHDLRGFEQSTLVYYVNSSTGVLASAVINQYPVAQHYRDCLLQNDDAESRAAELKAQYDTSFNAYRSSSHRYMTQDAINNARLYENSKWSENVNSALSYTPSSIKQQLGRGLLSPEVLLYAMDASFAGQRCTAEQVVRDWERACQVATRRRTCKTGVEFVKALAAGSSFDTLCWAWDSNGDACMLVAASHLSLWLQTNKFTEYMVVYHKSYPSEYVFIRDVLDYFSAIPAVQPLLEDATRECIDYVRHELRNKLQRAEFQRIVCRYLDECLGECLARRKEQQEQQEKIQQVLVEQLNEDLSKILEPAEGDLPTAAPSVPHDTPTVSTYVPSASQIPGLQVPGLELSADLPTTQRAQQSTAQTSIQHNSNCPPPVKKRGLVFKLNSSLSKKPLGSSKPAASVGEQAVSDAGATFMSATCLNAPISAVGNCSTSSPPLCPPKVSVDSCHVGPCTTAAVIPAVVAVPELDPVIVAAGDKDLATSAAHRNSSLVMSEQPSVSVTVVPVVVKPEDITAAPVAAPVLTSGQHQLNDLPESSTPDSILPVVLVAPIAAARSQEQGPAASCSAPGQAPISITSSNPAEDLLLGGGAATSTSTSACEDPADLPLGQEQQTVLSAPCSSDVSVAKQLGDVEGTAKPKEEDLPVEHDAPPLSRLQQPPKTSTRSPSKVSKKRPAPQQAPLVELLEDDLFCSPPRRPTRARVPASSQPTSSIARQRPAPNPTVLPRPSAELAPTPETCAFGHATPAFAQPSSAATPTLATAATPILTQSADVPAKQPSTEAVVVDPQAQVTPPPLLSLEVPSKVAAEPQYPSLVIATKPKPTQGSPGPWKELRCSSPIKAVQVSSSFASCALGEQQMGSQDDKQAGNLEQPSSKKQEVMLDLNQTGSPLPQRMPTRSRPENQIPDNYDPETHVLVTSIGVQCPSPRHSHIHAMNRDKKLRDGHPRHLQNRKRPAPAPAPGESPKRATRAHSLPPAVPGSNIPRASSQSSLFSTPTARSKAAAPPPRSSRHPRPPRPRKPAVQVPVCARFIPHSQLRAYSMQEQKSMVQAVKQAMAPDDTKASSQRAARTEERNVVKTDFITDAAKWKLVTAKTKSLKFGRSKVHAWGLFANQLIEADDFVIEYVGETIRCVLADVREQQYEASGLGSSYLFRIDDEWVVDATVRGGRARFINHSCDPNCYTKIFTVDGQRKIGIYAKRPIVPGEELFYDYKFEYETEDKKVPCHCGAKNCRKFLNYLEKATRTQKAAM